MNNSLFVKMLISREYQTNLVTNIGVWISIRSVIIAWYISKYQSKHYSNSSIPLLGSLSVKMANYWGLFLGLFRSFFRKFFARHFSRKMFRTAVFRFREKCEKLCSTKGDTNSGYFRKNKSGVRVLICYDGPHEFCNNKQTALQQHHDSLKTASKK